MELQEVLQRDDRFKYQLLSRMQSDCEYALGNGAIYGNHFWAGTASEQIEYIKGIYNNLTEKPEWLSMEQIEKYETEIGE